MASDISVSSISAASVSHIQDVRTPAAPEAGAHSPAVKQADSPAATDIKQSAKRANATLTAEKMQAQLDAAVEQLNKLAVNSGRGLQFKADPKLGRHIIMVTNTDTGEVVRTIPTDVAIRVAHGLEDIKGLLNDHAA